jgi:hypothetical protein
MKTRDSPGKQACDVAYNLLDGLVLVDGAPLGRLPDHFTSHATYARIFGNVSAKYFPLVMELMVN